MWLVGIAVVLNAVGLLVAIRAVLMLYAGRDEGRSGPVSTAALGSAGLLIGGCLLMAGGQYQVVALLYAAPHERLTSEFDPLTKAAGICGVALIGVGSVVARLRPRAARDADAPARRPGVVTAALLALAALAGLNLYQFVSHNRLMAESSQALWRDVPPLPVRSMTRHERVDPDVVRNYARAFHDNVFAEVRNRPRWFGIETLQNPNDAWLMQELIHAVKPDYIVETGTYNGGGALMWATILREVNPQGRVLTVDITDTSQAAREFDIWKERIEFFLGSSTDPKIFAEIERRARGGTVLVILDSHHGYDHVLAELKLYTPLVTLGSYIVVQDTYIDYPPAFHPHLGAGPWTAVKQFLRGNDRFEIDEDRERFLFTFNPRSQLKRIR